MKNVLFAGNGLNCISISPNIKNSWDNVLENLFRKYDVHNSYKTLFSQYNNEKEKIENVNLYEILSCEVCKKLKNNFNETSFQKNVKKDTFEMIKEKLRFGESNEPYNSLHLYAVQNYDEIITTNYDLCFENAVYNEIYKYKNKKGGFLPEYQFPASKEKRFSLNRKWEPKPEYIPQGEKCVSKIWHIHGAKKERGSCDSICQNREMYSKTLGKVSAYLTKNSQKFTKHLKNNNFRNVSEKLFENYIWHFFFSDIDIIGFGFADCELDLWHILSFRAHLIRKNGLQKGQYKYNRIRFFTSKDKKSTAKKLLMESLFVEVVEIDSKDIGLNKNENPYENEEYYKKCFEKNKSNNRSK